MSLQSQQPEPSVTQLDLSFSDDASKVSKRIKKASKTLTTLDIKGSIFEGIDEVINAICLCKELNYLDMTQVQDFRTKHANKILESCLKLKVFEMFDTSIRYIDLEADLLLEKLIISKTPFEFDKTFYQKINKLRGLVGLDVSYTNANLLQILENVPTYRHPALKILANSTPIDAVELQTFLESIDYSGQFQIKIDIKLKDLIVGRNPMLNKMFFWGALSC